MCSFFSSSIQLHKTCFFSPYNLLLGREPRLPFGITFGLRDKADNNFYSEYISELQQRIKDAFKISNKTAEKARRQHKTYYGLRSRAARLYIGDRVLVKILAHDGKHKLLDT